MYDIIVVGKGIVGLSTALAIAKSSPKRKIAVIAQKSTSKSDHVLAINANNIRYLLSLGVKISHNEHSMIEKMEIFGDHKSNINFDYLVNSNYYSKILSVQETIEALQHEINQLKNISQVEGKLTSIDQTTDKITVSINTLNSENLTINTKILIGADGANSLVRKAANIEMESIKYDHIAFTGTFQCEKHHNNTAIQYFLSNGGVIAYLPYGYKTVSIVYSCPLADDIMIECLKNKTNFNLESINNHIAKLTKYHFGKMSLVGSINHHNLQMNLVEKFYNKNIILIGDAAHTLHPLAGQGVNLGLQDVWDLVNLLKHQCNLNNLELSLSRYNRKRIIETRKIQLVCHGLFRLFNIQSPIIGSLRNYGINLVNKSPLLKKALLIR
jgi:2-octaprenylphenol hydroxylase